MEGPPSLVISEGKGVQSLVFPAGGAELRRGAFAALCAPWVHLQGGDSVSHRLEFTCDPMNIERGRAEAVHVDSREGGGTGGGLSPKPRRGRPFQTRSVLAPSVSCRCARREQCVAKRGSLRIPRTISRAHDRDFSLARPPRRGRGRRGRGGRARLGQSRACPSHRGLAAIASRRGMRRAAAARVVREWDRK